VPVNNATPAGLLAAARKYMKTAFASDYHSFEMLGWTETAE
jgi:hypothetical protein